MKSYVVPVHSHRRQPVMRQSLKKKVNELKSYSWLGRRKLILFTSPLVAVGWCIIGMAQNRAMLFVGRALASAAIHSYSSSVGVYISETG